MSKITLTQAMHQTHTHLQDLEKQIQQGMHMFDHDVLESIVHNLHQDSNQLATLLHHEAKEVGAIDIQLKEDLMHLLNTITKSGSFSQALGAFQGQLQMSLRRIENVIHKWKPKVTKVTQEPL